MSPGATSELQDRSRYIGQIVDTAVPRLADGYTAMDTYIPPGDFSSLVLHGLMKDLVTTLSSAQRDTMASLREGRGLTGIAETNRKLALTRDHVVRIGAKHQVPPQVTDQLVSAIEFAQDYLKESEVQSVLAGPERRQTAPAG